MVTDLYRYCWSPRRSHHPRPSRTGDSTAGSERSRPEPGSAPQSLTHPDPGGLAGDERAGERGVPAWDPRLLQRHMRGPIPVTMTEAARCVPPIPLRLLRHVERKDVAMGSVLRMRGCPRRCPRSAHCGGCLPARGTSTFLTATKPSPSIVPTLRPRLGGGAGALPLDRSKAIAHPARRTALASRHDGKRSGSAWRLSVSAHSVLQREHEDARPAPPGGG